MTILFKYWTLDGSASPTNYVGKFEYNGTYDYSASAKHLPGGWIDLVDDPMNRSIQAIRCTVKPDDAAYIGGARTELTPPDAHEVELSDWAGYEDSARWYRYQFLVPQEFDHTVVNPGDPTQRPKICQWHERPDTSPADYVGPATMHVWITLDGRVEIYNTLTSPATDTQTTSANWVERCVAWWPLQKNRWYDLLVRAQWGWTSSNASLEIWLDRRKIFSEVGATAQPNTFNNDPSRGGGTLYSKCGLYEKWSADWGAAVGRDRVIYHRGVIVGDESAVFADMFPEDPGAVELAPRAARFARMHSSDRGRIVS